MNTDMMADIALLLREEFPGLSYCRREDLVRKIMDTVGPHMPQEDGDWIDGYATGWATAHVEAKKAKATEGAVA